MRRLALCCLLLAPASACVRYVDSTDFADVEEPVRKLEIVGGVGHVDIEAVDDEPLHIERIIHAAEGSYPSAIHEFSGGVVHVDSRCDQSPRCEIRHRIKAPRAVAIAVDLDVAYLIIHDMSGPLELELETGNIDVVDVSSPEVRAAVKTGDIDLIFSVAPTSVDASVEVGTLTIAVPAGSYRCEFDRELTHTSIEGVTCDPAAAAVIRAHVEVGSLRLVGR